MSDTTVLIVGGGFAGVACAQLLAKHDVDVIMLDRNNYHQFQPMLYQVATAQLAADDIARPLRGIFRHDKTVEVRHTAVTSIDLDARSVTTTLGSVLSADYLVIAVGAQANFFGTPGAAEHSLPLYSVNDAERLRTRILEVLDATIERPELIEMGALNFVIVGGGPTGVETAGALAEALRDAVPEGYQSLAQSAQVHLVDHGEVLLAPFSDKAHAYAAKRLQDDGVTLHLGVGVKEVFPDRVTLSDGDTIMTHAVIWGGGEKPADVIAAAGLPQGHGGRIEVEPDLTVADHPQVYVLGDAANIAGADGKTLPQLGSVAQQSGSLDRPQHPRRDRRQGTYAVRLQRQGHHGHDRPQSHRRRDGCASARGGWPGSVRGLAGRPRHAAQRRTEQDRRVHRLGLGLLQQEPRDSDGQCT